MNKGKKNNNSITLIFYISIKIEIGWERKKDLKTEKENKLKMCEFLD